MVKIFSKKNNKLVSYITEEGLVIRTKDKAVIGFALGKGENIGTLVIPEGVLKIAENAFSNFEYMEDLNKVILPDSLQIIQDSAFQNCLIDEIKFGSGLKKIGHSAFSFCKNLKKITLPDSLEIIERDAFFGCDSLCEVNLGSGVKTILDGAFARCERMNFVKIPASVRAMEGYVFPYASEVVVHGDLPHNIFAALTSPYYLSYAEDYFFKNHTSVLRLVTDDGVKILPKFIDDDKASQCECALSSGIDELVQTIYQYSPELSASYDVAYHIYVNALESGKEPCEELTEYVKNHSEEIFLILVNRAGNEREAARLLRFGFISCEDLEQLRRKMEKDGRTELVAYIMDEIGKKNKRLSLDIEG